MTQIVPKSTFGMRSPNFALFLYTRANNGVKYRCVMELKLVICPGWVRPTPGVNLSKTKL